MILQYEESVRRMKEMDEATRRLNRTLATSSDAMVRLAEDWAASREDWAMSHHREPVKAQYHAASGVRVIVTHANSVVLPVEDEQGFSSITIPLQRHTISELHVKEEWDIREQASRDRVMTWLADQLCLGLEMPELLPYVEVREDKDFRRNAIIVQASVMAEEIPELNAIAVRERPEKLATRIPVSRAILEDSVMPNMALELDVPAPNLAWALRDLRT